MTLSMIQNKTDLYFLQCYRNESDLTYAYFVYMHMHGLARHKVMAESLISQRPSIDPRGS